MKFALLITVALIACAFGYTEMDHNNGHEILRELEAGNHNVYVIFFYAQASEGSALDTMNRDYENTLRENILENFGAFFYAKVNARNADYQELIDAVGINTTELQKSPSILIMEHGNGAWIHGPETISKIAEYAPAYQRRSENA